MMGRDIFDKDMYSKYRETLSETDCRYNGGDWNRETNKCEYVEDDFYKDMKTMGIDVNKIIGK